MGRPRRQSTRRVRIAPRYGATTTHVKDASRAVAVVSRLRGTEAEAYAAEIQSDHERLRQAFADAEDMKLTPLMDSRTGAPALSFDANTIAVPQHLDAVVQRDIPLGDIVPYIDWTPLFHAWELRGVYPQIFDREDVGPVARELHENATRQLQEIVDGGLIRAHSTFRFFRAGSEADDVTVFGDDGGRLVTLCGFAAAAPAQERHVPVLERLRGARGRQHGRLRRALCRDSW